MVKKHKNAKSERMTESNESDRYYTRPYIPQDVKLAQKDGSPAYTEFFEQHIIEVVYRRMYHNALVHARPHGRILAYSPGKRYGRGTEGSILRVPTLTGIEEYVIFGVYRSKIRCLSAYGELEEFKHNQKRANLECLVRS